jgi:hypothetical protein
MASTIGIKVANGEFYPIMEENSPVKKRLILTTAHDNQTSIQVDLYNSYAKTMADALYVGTLVVDNLQPRPKGEPNIEMTLSSNSAGRITASAVDLDSSAKEAPQHLGVSLTDVAENDRVNDEIPDFDLDLEPQDHPLRGLYDEDSSLMHFEQKKKFSRPLLVILILVLLLALGCLVYFFFFDSRGIEIRENFRRPGAPLALSQDPAPDITPPQNEGQTAPQVQEQAVPPPPPVISAALQPPPAAAEAPVDRTRTSAPVASSRVPRVIPKGGTSYTIRWGDTLWDISEAFYRNPWLYPRIARFNSIRDPDFIVSGRTIRIPPRN